MKQLRNDPEYRAFVEAHCGVIYGMLLGDSCVTRSANSYYLSTQHSAVQEQYTAHKYELLRPIMHPPRKYPRAGYTCGAVCDLRSRCHVLWKELRAVFYDESRKKNVCGHQVAQKVVNKAILERLDDHGVAVWFMDDGSLNSRRGKHGTLYEQFWLATHGFTKEECELIRDWFKETYGAQGSVIRQEDRRNGKTYWRILFGRLAFERILRRVAPYVPTCMEYKFRLRSPHRVQGNPDFGSKIGTKVRSELHGDVQSWLETASRLREEDEVLSGLHPT